MEFEWDEAKRRSNLEKHGLDFADLARIRVEERRVVVDVLEYGEERRFRLWACFVVARTVWFHRTRERYERMISFQKGETLERYAL